MAKTVKEVLEMGSNVKMVDIRFTDLPGTWQHFTIPVSELEGGLVQGFNNRLYLRGTTADGQVLTGVHLTVKRLWEPTDKGVNAPADEDGVASLQIDPGPPVNVVIPAQPFRPPPREGRCQTK